MKSLCFTLFFLTTLGASILRADETLTAALTAADDARITAMRNPDESTLAAAFSEDLRYTHSNGLVDTKATFLDVLVSGKTRYLNYDHVERSFTFPAPGIALMNGRARVRAETAKGQMDSTLSYLAVWRNEDGEWKFLAWQSCRLPPEEAKP
jgi:uncharacterized protein YlzI (FlbEa/FlbD family)